MKTVYALGFFDALHKGHRELIAEGFRLSQKFGAPFGLVTFDDNIYPTLGKDEKELYLFEEREELIRSAGVKIIKKLEATTEFLRKSPKEFLDFINLSDPCAIVVGTDYRFGYRAEGTVKDLVEYFSAKGVHVSVCDLLSCDGKKVSTTRIKELLSDGEVEKADELLCKPFFMTGRVTNGLQNGRKLGLPTANIDFDERKFIPKSGVYMTKTTVNGQKFLSVSNIGTHPTINAEKGNLETHILDFNEDIYENYIKVEFFKYIREIKKYSSAEELKKQIEKDIILTRKELTL